MLGNEALRLRDMVNLSGWRRVERIKFFFCLADLIVSGGNWSRISRYYEKDVKEPGCESLNCFLSGGWREEFEGLRSGCA